ncbi:hypothetical protein [Priestia endophytica]|uniref:hypothetical protein n=1 Tax=Priestia endophytica TaxID=135735 RepID=UPI00178C7C8A|nr:hypothetical protein [Priestia endophytica]
MEVKRREVKTEEEEPEDELVQSISSDQIKTRTNSEKSSKDRQAYRLLGVDI